MKRTTIPNYNTETRRYFFLLFAFVGMLLSGASASHAQVGKAWAWGYNPYGELGDGTNIFKYTPVQVVNIINVTQIVGGYDHSLVLKSDGTVWAWGWNPSGQLGDGTIVDKNSPVQAVGLTGVTQIAGGGYHSLALKSDGTVWAWGNNYGGQLGNGTNTDSPTPIQVSGLSGVTQIAGGGLYSLALKSDGTVWAWGGNSAGQLGDGTTVDSTTPIQVAGLTGVIQVAGGGGHSLALKPDGTVWAWGFNLYGQLGDGTKVEKHSPVQVSGLAGVVQVSAGNGHSLALKSDGTVWAWGRNRDGEIGDGTGGKNDAFNKSTPVQVLALSDVAHISGGGAHSLAIKTDGTVWGWGAASSGQLGNGNGTPLYTNTPVQTSIVKNQTLVSAGQNHSLSVQAVILKTKVSLSNSTLAYSKPITLSVTLKNGSLGGVLLNKPLTFSFDGSLVGIAYTIASGKANLLLPNPLAIGVGDHTLSVAFAGDRLYSTSLGTATLTITKADTSVSIGAYSGSLGNTKFIAATLKRKGDNTLLTGQTLTFKVDGNVIGAADTDGTGKASLSYKFDGTYSVGSHTLTANFAGDGNHNSSSGTGSLIITQASTFLSSSS
ncbi:MAG: Ig-like domain repeat protein, partial [Armatimonadetes bacterium]|nr:Ig-like domain repeat protein [Armatimonadota bacterium]